jgi:hypothetical protein
MASDAALNPNADKSDFSIRREHTGIFFSKSMDFVF